MNIENILKERNSTNEHFLSDPSVSQMEMNYVNKYRIIPIYDEITRDSVFKYLYWINKLIELDKKEKTKAPITLEISSYGGEVYHGLELISRIEQLKDDGYEIIGVVKGVACSMGSSILNVCSKRIAYRYSMILIHQVSSMCYGVYKEMSEGLDETKRLWDLLQDLYLKYTKINRDKLQEITDKKIDWILTPEEALRYGVVDEVL